MNLPVKKVENHTYNLKYGTADSTSRRNSGDAYSTTVGNAQDINMVRTAGFKSSPIGIPTSFYTAGLHTG